MSGSRSKKKDVWKVTKWVRADVPCEQPGLPFREALDLQKDLTTKEGAQDPEFIYTIEERG